MDFSESISFQMDTTSDSFDALNTTTNAPSPSRANVTTRTQRANKIQNERLSHDDELTRLPPDKFIIVDETPPSSSPSSSTNHSDTSTSQPLEHNQLKQEQSEPIASTSNPDQQQQLLASDQQDEQKCSKNSRHNGGSTLGMKKRHFLRRRIKVDLYEEVRRRSRREILLKIKFDKRKCEEQQLCGGRSNNYKSTSSSASSNTNTSDSDDDSFSDFSDISDSELESDSYIFLQPIGAKLRRTLLKASGVGRIDPKEKKECRKIRESRERSGCRCVDHCIPEYCECSRLGVNCHVDRASYPCGCISSGCRNPLGRTEFDETRVRGHFEEKVINSSPKAEETLNIQN